LRKQLELSGARTSSWSDATASGNLTAAEISKALFAVVPHLSAPPDPPMHTEPQEPVGQATSRRRPRRHSSHRRCERITGASSPAISSSGARRPAHPCQGQSHAKPQPP